MDRILEALRRNGWQVVQEMGMWCARRGTELLKIQPVGNNWSWATHTSRAGRRELLEYHDTLEELLAIIEAKV